MSDTDVPQERVTGIGGVFFKAEDPSALLAWYRAQLGIPDDEEGCASLHWREDEDPERRASTVFAPFAADTRYFEPSAKPFMLNFRVRDLDLMLAQLRAAGVEVDDKVEEMEFGRFGWCMDPEGNRIELWEPAE